MTEGNDLLAQYYQRLTRNTLCVLSQDGAHQAKSAPGPNIHQPPSISTLPKHGPPRSTHLPMKLYAMLKVKDNISVVSWNDDGRSFTVHDQKRFMEELAPQYFTFKQFKSFTRNLGFWNFKRFGHSLGRNSWRHQYFVRGMPQLLQHIKRIDHHMMVSWNHGDNAIGKANAQLQISLHQRMLQKNASNKRKIGGNGTFQSAISSHTMMLPIKKQMRIDNFNATINELTINNWVAIAGFLPKTTRALLAVALTAPISSWCKMGHSKEPSRASRAILTAVRADDAYTPLMDGICNETLYATPVYRPQLRLGRGQEGLDGSDYDTMFRFKLAQQLHEYYGTGNWELLDFVDIEKSLVTRLVDNDLRATLMCINAQTTLKELRLTHFIRVVGHGLEPLKFSKVLEKLDMGLMWHFERPCRAVDGALQLLEVTVFAIVDSILKTKGNMFHRLQLNANWCINGRPNEMLKAFLNMHANHILNGQSLCCYFNGDNKPDFASRFEKENFDLIDKCISCADCDCFCLCMDCNRVLCAEKTNDHNTCEGCGVRSCNECVKKFEATVRLCASSRCTHQFCPKCRLEECHQGSVTCGGCRNTIFSGLVELANARETEIFSIRREMEGKQQVIDKLQKEVKVLRRHVIAWTRKELALSKKKK